MVKAREGKTGRRRLFLLAAALAAALAAGGCDSEDEGDPELLTLLLQSTGFTDNGDGTVGQTINGQAMTWMKCAVGQVWNSGFNNCTGVGGGTVYGATSLQFCDVLTGNFADCTTADAVSPVASSGPAFNACDTLSLAGFTDWRLPSQGELGALVSFQSRDGILLTFPETPDDKFFWTRNGNPNQDEGTEAFAYSFAEQSFGQEQIVLKESVQYVRCIRP